MTGDRYGNIEIDTSEYEENPVDAFLKQKKSDESERTHQSWVQILKENRSTTPFVEFLKERDRTVLDATVTDLTDYAKYLEKQVNNTTIHGYLTSISSFYDNLRKLGVHDSNPAAYVLDKEGYEPEKVERNYHTVEEIGNFLKYIPRPEYRTAVLLAAKTGMRVGEICNIDLRNLHLDHSGYKAYLEEQGINLVQKVARRPDTLLVYSDFNAGDVINGEERRNGNKRKRETQIPIDSEVKQSLLDWLSIRPDRTEPSKPLFTTSKLIHEKYPRLHAASLTMQVVDYAQEFGIAEDDGNREDVDMHYFRHFFTTQMAKNRGDHPGGLDPMLIKYLRGDVIEDSILDIYTHDSWGVNVREDYLENIYTFGLYD